MQAASTSSAKRDYYDLLRAERDASPKTIKKLYRTAAKKHHPDRHTDKSADEKEAHASKFKLLSEAYEVLSDTQKRSMYDLYGHADVDGEQTSADDFAELFGGFGNAQAHSPPKPSSLPGGNLFVINEQFFQVKYADMEEWRRVTEAAKVERPMATSLIEESGKYRVEAAAPPGPWEVLLLDSQDEGSMITVTLRAGEKLGDAEWEELRPHLRVTRSFTLPSDADLLAADVSVADGVLCLYVPKVTPPVEQCSPIEDQTARTAVHQMAVPGTAVPEMAVPTDLTPPLLLSPTSPTVIEAAFCGAASQTKKGMPSQGVKLKKDFFQKPKVKKHKQCHDANMDLAQEMPVEHNENEMAANGSEALAKRPGLRQKKWEVC